MQDQEKGRLLTAAEVAEIWNERSLAMGYPDTHYTRFSVRQRHRKGKKGLIPALETPIGFLYWEKDVRDFPLQPQKSRKKRGKDEDEHDPREISVTPHMVQLSQPACWVA